MNQISGSHFFDRYDRFIKNARAATGPESDISDATRLRHRYNAIVTHNRELFQGARVLDLMSSFGFWCLAALDAGAAHVVGVEAARKPAEAAKKAFADLPLKPASYQFINSEIFAALRNFDPKSFDVVLCHGFLERADPRVLFQQLSRLRAKHVILDTRIVRGKGPIVRLMDRSGAAVVKKGAARYNSILSVPNHELITFFCDYSQFSCRQIDWKAAGITDWAGVTDYQKDTHRTYVLERTAAAAADPADPAAAAKPARRAARRAAARAAR